MAVNALCEQLVQAVTVIMEPDSSQQYRMEALRFCEEFKESCQVCVPCGLQLADKTQRPVVRHFGLQVLEHVIKFRWNDMSAVDKLCLKDSVIGLISNGMHSIMEEEGHIKDVFARIVVEMIKREWPQHWPDMLSELERLARKGEAQTELVMLILLRLAEDVVTFHSLPQQRRRDIHTTMTQNMDTLFSFMMSVLQQSVTQYTLLKNDPSQKLKGQGLWRVAVSALNTLAGYIDWVHISHVVCDDCQLLKMLCVLLCEPELQVEAAECLLIAVNRKGKLDDRRPLLILFGDSAMNYILSAAQMADVDGLAEKCYVFLKRLSQVLCALGTQICALTVPTDPNAKIPENLGQYLDALLAFSRHPSLFLRSSTLLTWGMLFRHEVLAKDPQLLSAAHKFLQISMTNIVKVGFPSRNDSPSCVYSRLDFDGDEDFNTFFSSFRSLIRNVLKVACRLDPQAGFRMSGEWLRYQLAAPVDTESQSSKLVRSLCCLLSPSFAQWDAMTVFCECVIREAVSSLQEEDAHVAEGIELLKAILNYETNDPYILSCVLTNLSTFFPFVRYSPVQMSPVLYKLFDMVTYADNEKAIQSRIVKNVRRHASCCLLKICGSYPELVLPHFEFLFTRIKMLLEQYQVLGQMERCSLMEVLVLLSNQFKDLEKQRSFLTELISPLVTIWLSEEVQRATSSPEEFISFVGAEALCMGRVDEDPCRLNRARLSFCAFAMLRVVVKARWPGNLEEAKMGGFVVGYTPSGTPLYQHPCSQMVLKLFDSLLSLIRSHNNIYRPDILSKMGDTFSQAIDMLEVEKKCILGKPVMETSDVPVPKSLVEKLQWFFSSSFENCYQILGECGQCLQQDFYSMSDLVPRLLSSAFTNLDNLPDFRLRPILRIFVKPFILSCPPEKYESLVVPILGPLISYVHQRLSHKWLYLNQRDLVSEEAEPDGVGECKEMLDEQLVCLVSRELMDLLVTCCVLKKNHGGQIAAADSVLSASQVETEDEEMLCTEAVPAPGSVELTDLGKLLMANEEISALLLVTVYSPLVWKDTVTCLKASVLLCWPLLNQVISASLPSDAIVCFFTNVLRGLQIHGQHEGCLNSLTLLAFHLYEALRPQCNALRTVMEQVPDIALESLEQFDSRLLLPKQKISVKKRRDHFKRLISGCIEKPLGEQFRKEVHIRNLPRLFQKKSKPQPDGDLTLDHCAESLPALFQP
ncbi:exportin-5 [Pelodytes ibericus]